MTEAALLWAPRAWLPSGWREGVLLEVDRDGSWARVTADVPQVPTGATALAGPMIPSLVDGHSHAFQRAFAGLAEHRESAEDDFWSWRDRMYRVALRITPEHLRSIAAQLYVELLHGGYTQVCEFHYLQHDRNGSAYADSLDLSWALADAAADAGIGLTMLPVLYERAGFDQPELRDDQRRFRMSAQDVWAAYRRVAASGRPMLRAGLAIHSLRAAAPSSIGALRALADGDTSPIHIHVAEQTREVDDCLGATGSRPIEWLAREGLLDSRWHLVHATHATRGEIESAARSGAAVIVCPSTEANLGDGFCDLDALIDAGLPITIGSDSNVTRDWREELRWLEYAQRLKLRRRNIAARPRAGVFSTTESLLTRALGGAAAGEPAWGLLPGARADALVVDAQAPGVLGVAAPQFLDALVFSTPGESWRDVMVAGRWVVRDHRHAQGLAIAQRFQRAMEAIWSER